MRQVLLVSSSKLREQGIDAPDFFLQQTVLGVQRDLLQIVIGEPLLDYLLHLVQSHLIELPQHLPLRELLDTYLQPLLIFRVGAIVAYHQSLSISKVGVYRVSPQGASITLTPNELEDLILSYNTQVGYLSYAARSAVVDLIDQGLPHPAGGLFEKPTHPIPDYTCPILL